MKIIIALFLLVSQPEEQTVSEYFIQFDTIKVQLAKQKCGQSDMCHIHGFQKEVIRRFNPTKIIDTNIPKYIKIETDGNFYWFKIWNT